MKLSVVLRTRAFWWKNRYINPISLKSWKKAFIAGVTDVYNLYVGAAGVLGVVQSFGRSVRG
jgi:hypothetical protein